MSCSQQEFSNGVAEFAKVSPSIAVVFLNWFHVIP